MARSGMALLRIAIERLLLALFWIARSAFLACALAMVTATVATALVVGGAAVPPWLGAVARSCGLLGGTALLAAVLLFAAPHLGERAVGGDADGPPAWVWPLLIGLSLVLLPALTWARSTELVALWREIRVLLDRVGFWDAFQGADPFAGIAILPILAALLVPALETAAACFLIAAPLGLLALLPTRSRLFPRFFAMMVVCQAGLVVASLIGADAFSRLAAEAISAMTASGDAEVQQAAEALGRARDVLYSTAGAFVLPTLGYLAWVPALLLSRRVAAFFDAGAHPGEPAPIPASSAAPIGPRVFRAEPSAHSGPKPGGERRLPRAPARVPDRRGRVALVALGTLMLVCAQANSLRSSARYERSDPPAGAALASPPAAVRVTFGSALDPSSRLYVDRMAPGEAAARVGVSSGLDPGDPERRTLFADLSGASAGFYRVSWSALPAAGGVARSGWLHFGVGMPGAASVPEGEAPLVERTAGARGWRNAVVGGALLIFFGALLPRLAHRA